MERTPHTPNDEQLSQIVDGVAPGNVGDVALDASAQARLQAWQQWNDQMQHQLLRWDCPPSQQLADYHWGDVNQATARTIARHLEVCALCSDEIETLRVFLATDAAQPAPPTVSPPSPSFRPRLREFVAAIVPRVPALAVRGDQHGPLVAEAGEITLVLDVQNGNDGNVAVLGQVAAPDPDRWTGALVEIRQNNVVRAVAETDDIGSFRCASVPQGASELRITAPDGVSVVLSVELGNGDKVTR